MSRPCGPSLPGSPRAFDLVRDGVAGALAHRVVTATTVLVLAVVTLVVLVTAGQSAAAERQIISRVDSVGTRLLVVSDDAGDAGILPDAVAQVGRLSDVSWVVGLGAVTDVDNVALRSDRTGVPSRPIVGGLPPGVEIVAGRAPRDGEAVAGEAAARALGLLDGVGTVGPTELLQSGDVIERDARLVPVVGVVRLTDELARLDGSVLVASVPAAVDHVRFLYVMSTGFAVVERLGDTLPGTVPAVDATRLTVETPSGALALREVIAGDLGASSRRLMAVVLGVGAMITAVTMFGAVAGRRREFGRRRALGATRSAIVAVVVLQAGCAAAVGAALGVTGGLLVLARSVGDRPAPVFVLGVAGLAVVVALLGSVPPALAAAFRDPMRILRVP